ncbi:hypothetical protein QE152_g4621 [Popillia japonica]|uniref:Uncharacterized protein n=2 Tax=Popillia japonica TaxID=7064 RepID=A0AAW1MY70_POPJA
METREDIPLKSNSKSSSLGSCNEYLFKGSRFITTAFVFLTIVITVALLLQIYYGDFQVVPHGSVATDSKDCSEIGTLILKQGGNSVDAAIAAAICLAVVCPHTSGLDATAAILIYSHKSRENPVSFDFVHHEILTPSVELTRRGFLVSYQLAQAIKKAKVKKLFKHVDAGERMILENLGDTLQRISEIPSKELYKVAKYPGKIVRRVATKKLFRNYNIFYPKAHNIGELLYFNLEHIEKMKFTQKDINGIDYIYNLANTTLNIYNEYNYWSEFHQGTASNIGVMDLDDLYVSLIIGMHSPFGTQQMTIDGYITDNKTNTSYTILPVIATDARFICVYYL